MIVLVAQRASKLCSKERQRILDNYELKKVS